MALPETVDTPMGVQPFDKAVRWHLPSMLRWIAENPTEGRLPGGELQGSTLFAAADRLERLAAQSDPIDHGNRKFTETHGAGSGFSSFHGDIV